MTRTFLFIALLACMLAACVPAPVTETASVPVSTTAPEIAVEPQGKLPAPSFESQTFTDETTGFLFEYPATWAVRDPLTIGDRGQQTVLVSDPALVNAESLPAGVTRLVVNVNDWEPRNDLAAYVANQKAAWEASGLTVLSEESLMLDLGLKVVRIQLQAYEGVEILFQFAAIGDRYVTLNGEGDLTTVAEIMTYLRPLNQ